MTRSRLVIIVAKWFVKFQDFMNRNTSVKGKWPLLSPSIKGRSPTRKKHLQKLRLLGNFHHNVTVLETGKRELILKRRPSSAE